MKHIILGFKDVGISNLKSEGHYGIGFHDLDLPVKTIGDEVKKPQISDLHTVITSVNREGLLVLKAAVDRAINQWDLDHKERRDE